MASVAVAKEREPKIRNVTLPNGPEDIARPVFVAGSIATVLRFEKEVDAARTEIVGWKGRFEPLVVGGKKVVIEPIYDLTEGDRLPLVVTLVDGTQVPFTIQAADEGQVDHQVNLFWDRESDKYLRADLKNALWRERLYLEENRRYEKEESSQDHALATLLVTGAVKQTPFRRIRRYVFKEVDAEIGVTVYAGKSKAAVLFTVKNHADEFWRVNEVRLTSMSDFDSPSPETRQCAVRMLPRAIAPGASGSLAIVADRSAFVSDAGLEALALQIIRHDGLVQAFVMLDPSLVRE
jgi:hypothetical protein